MTLRTFKEIGIHLTRNWGFEDNGNYKAKIEQLTDEAKIACLIAAAVSELMIANTQQMTAATIQCDLLRNLRVGKDNPKNTDHPVSDGAFHVLHRTLKDKTIDEQLELHCPSVRARTILAKSGLKFCSEVTRANLKGIKNCGVSTIHELEEWAKL